MTLKKRGAIYSVIALMLCAAVYLNWNYNKNNIDPGDDEAVSADYAVAGSMVNDSVLTSSYVQTTSDYFSEARLSRQKARDESVSILHGTIDNINSTEEAVTAASAGIQTLADNTVLESRIESLVIAKGYKDCVTYINENAVNVIVSKTENGLSDTDVAKIRDIVINEADVTADKIKIIETE